MIRLRVFFAFLYLGILSCQNDDRILDEQTVQFSAIVSAAGGRLTSDAEPQSVLVTITDDEGKIVANRQELQLYQFGEGYISVPLTLKTTGNSKYLLTEFFVTDSTHSIRYATPLKGSTKAHLVDDPLAIEFAIIKNAITIVTPEVIELDENSDPADFGYGQFGFKIVNTIDVVFSSFIKGVDNLELTNSHLKVEGLSGPQSDASVLWSYETDLQAKANIITLKQAPNYRITVVKPNYVQWERDIALLANQAVDIELIQTSTQEVDIYVGGKALSSDNWEVATYWKNEVPIHIDSDPSSIYNMIVAGEDVYAIGIQTGLETAFYWKNTVQVMLDHSGKGKVTGLFVSGNDIYVSGYLYETGPGPAGLNYYHPVFWKNGELFQLTLPTLDWNWGKTSGISVDGSDVYISGYHQKLNSGNTGFISKPVLWKNGIMTELPTDALIKSGLALGMSVKDGHSYSMGILTDTGGNSNYGYWKDFQLIDLPGVSGLGIYLSSSFIFTVNDDNFYFLTGAGEGSYWKGTEKVVVSPELFKKPEIYGMVFNNGIVYLAGQYFVKTGETTQASPAAYWINGVLHELPIQTSTGYTIQIVPK